MNDTWNLIVAAWDLLIKIIDVILRVLNAAFFITIAWGVMKEKNK